MFKATLKAGVETRIFGRTPSQKIKTMVDKAVDLMTNTKDSSHGIDHVNNLLKNTNRFFKSTGKQFDINKEILLLALHWHDTWKSQHKPTVSNYLFHQLYEGLGSMFMFMKHAKVVGLPPRITSSVSYVIRKHSAVQILPAKTPEAQLLWDVDILDLWNSHRVQAVFKNFGCTNISIFDSYIQYMKRADFHLHFEWTRNEMKKMKSLFFEDMSQFREALMNGNELGIIDDCQRTPARTF